MKTRLPSLDGLRGVAALAVVGSHFENLSGYSLHLQHAGVAVDFFFMLSGFVIGQAYEPRLKAGLGWGSYMLIRLKRLYPAILGGLALGVVALLVAGDAFQPIMLVEFLLLPVLIGPALHGGELFPLDGPQWSLFEELLVNALHAAALPWLTTRRLIVITILAAAVLVAASLHFGGLDAGWARQNLWGGPPRAIFGFGAGVLIFRACAAGFRPPATPYVAVMAGLALCLVRPFPEQGLYAWTDLVIVLIILPALVVLAVSCEVSAWASPIAVWLGALSYPLYAIHAPILRLFEAGLRTLSDDQALIGWLIAAPATVLLATLFERVYDAPVQTWLRRSGR